MSYCCTAQDNNSRIQAGVELSMSLSYTTRGRECRNTVRSLFENVCILQIILNILVRFAEKKGVAAYVNQQNFFAVMIYFAFPHNY